MNDLEDRLRADFQQATAGVEDQVNAEAALLAGQRVRSSRRIGATVGITAMAAVAGLVGWTVLRVVPITGGVPAPMQTMSAVPSTPATPSDPLSTTFEIDGLINGTLPTYDSIKVGVKPSGEEVGVTVTMAKAGTQPVVRDFTTKAGSYWYVALDKHLAIGIVPERVVHWLGVEADSDKAVVSGEQPLDGIGATAFWVGFEKAGGSDTVRGVIWEGGDGAVRDSLGTEAGSARVPLDGDEYLIYRDPALDSLGIMASRGGGGRYSFRISDYKPSDLLAGGMGRKADDGTWTWVQFGTLPPGSHDIKVGLDSGEGEWSSAVMSDGYVVLMAINHSKSKGGNIVTSISYIDANGKLVHYPK